MPKSKEEKMITQKETPKNLLRMFLYGIKKKDGKYFFDLRTNENQPEKLYEGFKFKGKLISIYLIEKLKSLGEIYFNDKNEEAKFLYENNEEIKFKKVLPVWVTVVLRQDKDNNIDFLINTISQRIIK